MGKRGWLNNLLNDKILPAIAQLHDSVEDRAEIERLAQNLRDNWIEHGHIELKQQQSLMDQSRKAIKNRFGEDHFSLNYIKFSTEEYTRLNDEKQRSVAERNEDVKQIENPDGIVSEAVRLLDSPEWADVAAGLAVLTGRRSSELLSTAEFEPKTRWSVIFTGALKRKGELKTLSFEIPTLTTSEKVCKALNKIRQQLPEAQKLSAAEVNSRYGQAVAAACDRHFTNLVPPRTGGNLYTHLFRAVYATIATFWYCPPKVDPVEFRAAIQGHYAVLDEANPELRRSLAASRHYADFEIADKVIAQYAGKRKGIKLGVGGIQPIEAFENAMDENQPKEPQRKHRSSLRIWKEDHDQVAAILAHFPGKTQQEKVSAWIAWTEKRLTLTPPGVESEIAPSEVTEDVAPRTDTIAGEPEQLQEIKTPESIQSKEPVANSLEQPVSSGLEGKLDKLIDVMAGFMQLQMQIQQQAMVQPTSALISSQARATTPKPVPTPQPAKATSDEAIDNTEDIGESKPRKYKTGEADAIVNRAIDAIMEHNNQPDQPHDLKWEITINGLKTYTANQRVIERIVAERRAEINAHHQQHQIQPGHNNRHKRKRKIGDVIQL